MIPEVLALLAERSRLQRRKNQMTTREYHPEPLVPWLKANYLIPETSAPIIMPAHQQAVLDYAFQRDNNGKFKYTTVIYSAPKKCLGPETRVLRADLRWVRVDSLRVGDQLLAFDENTRWHGEGRPPGGSARRYRVATVLQTGMKMMPARRMTLESGVQITASREHRWLNKVRGGANLKWVRTDKLKVGDWLSKYLEPWDDPTTYDAGYMAGVFDGEGSVRPDIRELGFGQKKNQLLGKALGILRADGVPINVNTQRSVYDGHDYCLEYVTVSGRAWTLWALGHYRPVRLLDKTWGKLDGKMGQIWRLGDVPIIAIEDIEAPLITLSTSTETYFAEGFAAHNSGKSAISGGIGRWAGETWGGFGEIYYMGNDAEQAKERGFRAHKTSLQLHPEYNRRKEFLEGRWLVGGDKMLCLTTGTTVKALSMDYAGEAGANPILTIWEELWGFIHKDALRFWAEMAPSPTRLNSMRLVVTYAGYEGESELLANLYRATVHEGRQLTAGELSIPGAFSEAQNPADKVPCWVNDPARMFCYWDSGEVAHRMPWQKGEKGREYYASEARTQTEQQFRRLHFNEWVSGESEFVPIHWWDACKDGPEPLKKGDLTPMVIALDAAVTGDCFGLTMGRRLPPAVGGTADRVRPLICKKWEPPKGGAIDFREPEAMVKELCADFNVVEVCYDAYQLHDFCTRLRNDGVANFQEFSQGGDRIEADTQLYQLIANRRIVHDGSPELREHIQNCNAKLSKDEDNRMRIIKKAENRKIDLAVCLSMMSHELLRLNL